MRVLRGRVQCRRTAAHQDTDGTGGIVAYPLAGGATYCALRLRAHDDDASVLTGDDLVPALLELLRETLEEQ